MVAAVIIIDNAEGVLQDQDGHARNKASQKIDAQGNPWFKGKFV